MDNFYLKPMPDRLFIRFSSITRKMILEIKRQKEKW